MTKMESNMEMFTNSRGKFLTSSFVHSIFFGQSDLFVFPACHVWVPEGHGCKKRVDLCPRVLSKMGIRSMMSWGYDHSRRDPWEWLHPCEGIEYPFPILRKNKKNKKKKKNNYNTTTLQHYNTTTLQLQLLQATYTTSMNNNLSFPGNNFHQETVDMYWVWIWGPVHCSNRGEIASHNGWEWVYFSLFYHILILMYPSWLHIRKKNVAPKILMASEVNEFYPTCSDYYSSWTPLKNRNVSSYDVTKSWVLGFFRCPALRRRRMADGYSLGTKGIKFGVS